MSTIIGIVIIFTIGCSSKPDGVPAAAAVNASKEDDLARTLENGFWYYKFGQNEESDKLALSLIRSEGKFSADEVVNKIAPLLLAGKGEQMVVILLFSKEHKVIAFGGFYSGDSLTPASLSNSTLGSGELDGWQGEWNLPENGFADDSHIIMHVAANRKGKQIELRLGMSFIEEKAIKIKLDSDRVETVILQHGDF